MTSRRKKRSTDPINLALKSAIFASGFTQRVVAQAARIHETRMSHIVRGRLEADEAERARLAKVLRQPVESLFPIAAPAEAIETTAQDGQP